MGASSLARRIVALNRPGCKRRWWIGAQSYSSGRSKTAAALPWYGCGFFGAVT